MVEFRTERFCAFSTVEFHLSFAKKGLRHTQKIPMYIRFESRVRDYDARCNQGVFCAAFDVWYDRDDLQNLWQVQEMRRVLDWFNDHLNAPMRVSYRPGKKAEINGVCWFRATSGVFVSRGRYLAWLLEDLGYPITERHTRHPGRFLWEDAHQVVAAQDL